MTTGSISFMSPALGRHVTYSFILPDPEAAGPGPYNVLVQLHGLSDDHQAWLNRSNLFRHVQGLPLIVVMPDGARSFWINHNPRDSYGDFLNRDLRRHVLGAFQALDTRWALGGLSMGGYGALYNGLAHPELYASVWAHSSACFRETDFDRESDPQPSPLTPDSPEAADLFALASRVDKATLPTLSFDCGSEDFLIEHNRRFHDHLTTLGLEHRYIENTGAHEWDYWDIHVREALEQHARVLGIARK